ncbi:maltokinase N-terminal cap-like domain-containing protein [Streptomyces sp. CB02261]|uniref:maltokinase N-terminal cap-like domain-containing protein n=1 Tax=Streptomyces sp. CB02261 TaxID=1703940 RepID=UPI000938EB08|nr:1,4-alpha-glucan branching protein [Streptomyces sp. CB02261]OKJ65997.1 1,4-alpha-glucan branching protein [Streptomyces sp. CB02261]
MAVIHATTLQPNKIELLTEWLPAQEWYSGADARPVQAGGFRLDDPAGEVGIELMVVTDGEGDAAVTYFTPMTYRSGPVAGAEPALIGTMEHGVLGRRWVHDATHDPVFVAQLYALLTGRAQAQAQSESGAPDPTVAVTPAPAEGPADAELVRVTGGADHTDVVVRVPGASAPLTLRVHRVLRADAAPATESTGRVTAQWQLPDGTTARGEVAAVLTGPART